MITFSESVPWGWTIASKILKRVREALGLQRCQVMLSGAAPIHTDVLEFFMSVGLPILEVYGMSENSGPQTCNIIGKWKPGSVGVTCPGCKTKIDNPDEDGEGEVGYECQLFGSVTMLYYVRFACLAGMCSWVTSTMRRRPRTPSMMRGGCTLGTLARLTRRVSSSSQGESKVKTPISKNLLLCFHHFRAHHHIWWREYGPSSSGRSY